MTSYIKKIELNDGRLEIIMEIEKIDQSKLFSAFSILSQRCLNQAASWILEFISESESNSKISMESQNPNYLLAKSMFNLGEFQKAIFVLNNNEDQNSIGLKYLCKLLNTQRTLDQTVSDKASFLGTLPVPENSNYDSYASLIKEIEPLEQTLDFINLYIYASILVKGGRYKEAVPILQKSINGFPLNRSAWNLLLRTLLRFDNAFIMNIIESLPNHWMAWFFKAELFSEIQMLDQSIESFKKLINELGISRTSSVIALEAKIYYHNSNYPHAQTLFEELRLTDPYHFETLELYSNILYVKGDISALSELSQSLAEINKYRPETLIVSGNFYALNGRHDEAISNFSMALRADSSFTFAWTLIGHEFAELENISAAMSAYSKAYENNPHDFRAIYGLGRVYEMSKMPYHAALFYRNAVIINPADWRMWIALGDCYEELFENDNALLCYKRAIKLQNCDPIVYYKLGLNFQNREDFVRAAFCFETFINTNTDKIKEIKDSMMRLHLYYININNIEKANEIKRRRDEYSQDFSDIETSSSIM